MAGTDKVDMLIMSTRARSSMPGEIYSGERALTDFSLQSRRVDTPG